MSDGDAREQLRKLESRLEAARQGLRGDARDAAKEEPSPFGAALAMAWRIGLELVVAVAVGLALGWVIDRWFGTRPWGMIALFFLGVAAGMMNVWRAVKGMTGAVGYRQEDDRHKDGAQARRDED
jgi:ATP synthase protein I